MKTNLIKIAERLFDEKLNSLNNFLPPIQKRSPVHVVYGGANLFKSETPRKLGQSALKSLHEYAPDFIEFSKALWLKGADHLPIYKHSIMEDVEISDRSQAEKEAFGFAQKIYWRTIEKLSREPVEDFRIDFEDGYGFRTDEEENSHAITASNELAKSFLENTITPFCGFRIKSFQKETFKRAVKTLDLFLTNFIEKTDGKIPENFVVTLPKIVRAEEVSILAELLDAFETQYNLSKNSVGIELMFETPQAFFNDKGELNLRNLVEAASGRATSAHFGAYDFTSAFGISGVHQHLRHDSCNFARQLMQISLAPLEIRLSDSVTIEMPTPVHRRENLSDTEIKENFQAVHTAWRKHFNNITHSLINGFYQSWDLHPAQLVARYAAVYSFFSESAELQGKRLNGFIKKATQANMTGNTFDDAASAQGLVIFFRRALGCGAMTNEEILQATGLKEAELMNFSFKDFSAKIV